MNGLFTKEVLEDLVTTESVYRIYRETFLKEVIHHEEYENLVGARLALLRFGWLLEIGKVKGFKPLICDK